MSNPRRLINLKAQTIVAMNELSYDWDDITFIGNKSRTLEISVEDFKITSDVDFEPHFTCLEIMDDLIIELNKLEYIAYDNIDTFTWRYHKIYTPAQQISSPFKGFN